VKIALAAVVLFLVSGLFAQMQPGSLIKVDNLLELTIGDDGVKSAGENGFVFWFAANRNVLVYQTFDGKTTYKYDLKQVENNKVDRTHNWSDFTSDGSSVYVLWNLVLKYRPPVTNCALSRFDIGGQYRGTIKLDGEFGFCRQIAVLDHGRMIVGGEKLDGKPFLCMFQTNGQLIREVHLPRDVRLTNKKPDKEKLAELEVKNESDLEEYSSWTLMDSDGDGNVAITRRIVDTHVEGRSADPWVVFVITRTGEITRFTLERPKTRFGNTFVIRPLNRHVITIDMEQDNPSSFLHLWLRAYTFDGKRVTEYELARPLGPPLLDWNEHRALFATQPRNPRDMPNQFVMIEGVPR
jgi:hypothetical protein